MPAAATATSHGCSPATFGQDANLDAALVDAPNHDTEFLTLPPLPLSDPTFDAAAWPMSEEEKEKENKGGLNGLNVLVCAAMRVTEINEKQKAHARKRVRKWRMDKRF